VRYSAALLKTRGREVVAVEETHRHFTARDIDEARQQAQRAMGLEDAAVVTLENSLGYAGRPELLEELKEKVLARLAEEGMVEINPRQLELWAAYERNPDGTVGRGRLLAVAPEEG